MRKLTKAQLAKRVKVLAQLKLNEGNVSRTSKQTGVTRTTIRSWRDANKNAERIEQLKKEREEKEQQVIAETVEKVLRLTENHMEELAVELQQSVLALLKNPHRNWNPKDLTWCLAVVVDKLQILKGKPTSIIENLTNLSEEERAKKVAELLAKGRQRRLNAGGQTMAIVETELSSQHGNRN